MILLALLVTFSVAGSACDSTSAKDETDQASQQRASDAGTSCPGATAAQLEQENHPRVLRGRVLAPQGALAHNGIFPDWIVPTAKAAPLEEEQPVANASVELFEVDATGQREGDILRSTRTDGRGEWCMGLPDDVEVGTNLMLRASGEEITLRRILAIRSAGDISTGSEAIVRILQDRMVDFAKLPSESYINLEAIADTAVDLLEPVDVADDDSAEDLISRIRETLLDDTRFTRKLSNLPKRDR